MSSWTRERLVAMPPRRKTVTGTGTEDETQGVVAPTKKRERKSTKHQVVAVVTQDGIQGMFTPELKRPLIAHLPIHSHEVKFYGQAPQYDPNPPSNPVAYEDSMTNPFAELNENQPAVAEVGGKVTEISKDVAVEDQNLFSMPAPVTKKSIAQTNSVASSSAPIEYGPTKLLVAFANSSETKELPQCTSVACFWCCETFENKPCVIPTSVIDSVWNVYGNFCTPHCASAYLLSELLDTHVRWSRLALLHRLYAKACGGRIYPSPHRECLERFGGPISTEEFKRLCNERKVRADIHFPPMVSIMASMDTKPIDFYETSLQNTTPNAPIHYSSDGVLKLKRSKPLKDRESTLDACLNIQIRS